MSLSKKYGGVCPVVHSVNIRQAYALLLKSLIVFRLYSLQHANASGLVRKRSEGYVITWFTTAYWFDGGTRTDRHDVDRLPTRRTAMDANAVGSICLAYLA